MELRKLVRILTCLIITMLSAWEFSYGEESVITRVSQVYSLDMWHYSGLYWKVGNYGCEQIKISDKEMDTLGGISGYLESSEPAVFSLALPSGVRDAIAGGRDVGWRLEGDGVELEEIFVSTSLREISFSTSELSFSIKPRFNFSAGYTLSSFVTGMTSTVPLIDKDYGCNIYSIFGGGFHGVQMNGYFDSLEPTEIVSPYIHPLMIKDKTGALLPGYQVYSLGKVYDSSGLSVGSGTFSAAGACGLSFSFPVRIVFFYTDGAGGAGDDPGGGSGAPDDPDGSDNPDDPDGPDDPEEPEISISASLDLPSETWEGHTEEAYDCSTVEVDGETLSAETAYKKGIAHSSLKVSPNAETVMHKTSSVSTDIRFDTAGTYNVTLSLSAGSLKDRDVKSIVVKRCPDIAVSLGGLQKQNRRQVLTGRVMQNPNYPITLLTVVIRDKKSGEAISISRHLDGSQEDEPVNSANIKYRTITGRDTEFYRSFELEFLSKFNEDREFQYEVYVRDTRGYTDSVTADFTVVKDKPPVAAIDISERYYRRIGGGPAQISLSDASTSDGDKLLRQWFYSSDGKNYKPITKYEDFSFGSLRDICIEKADVGWFYIRLIVRDDWKEDTLLEYITDADYLGDSTWVKSMVDNIAPKVSLSLSSVRSGEVLLYSSDRVAAAKLEGSVESLRLKLLERGVDADIKIASLPASGSVSGRVTNMGSITSPMGFQGRWPYKNSFWEMYSAAADSERFYKASCSWPVGSDFYECYPTQPYVITAYNRNNLSTLWTFSISKSFLDISFDEARFGHDFENKYLYIAAAGKTILLDKSGGGFVTVIGSELGPSNSVTDKYIYTYKEDGIYRYPRSGGAAKKIFVGELFAGEGMVTEFEGNVCFVFKSGCRLIAARFDPETEGLKYVPLQGTEGDEGTAKSRLLGIDSYGTVVINTDAKVRVFDKNGVLIKTLPGGELADVVVSPSGRFNYITVRSDSYYSYKGDESYGAMIKVYGIYSSYSDSISVSSETDYPTDVSRLCVAMEDGSGNILIGCGAWFDYVRGLGMPFGQRFMVFKFNPVSRTKSTLGPGAVAPGLTAGIEWSCRGQGYMVLTSANNLPAGGYNTAYFLNVSESKEGALERLKRQLLSGERDYCVVKEFSSGFNLDALADSIASDSGINTCIVRGSSSASGISRGLRLEAGRTYYYEYDTSLNSDAVSVTASYSGSGASSDTYNVIREFPENFNDSNYNVFFSLEKSKVKSAAYYMVDVTTDGYINKSGSVSFTVPAGCYAAVSFDYNGRSTRGSGYSYFSLSRNGAAAEAWEGGHEPDTNSISGSYTWKKLLPAGTYVLSGTVKSYSNFENNHCWLAIDNLKVVLLKKGVTPAGSYVVLTTDSFVSGAGDLNHVKGSFTAPLSQISYSYYKTEAVTGIPETTEHTFAVPGGQTALCWTYTVNSNPYEYYTSKDAYRGVSVSWLWDQSRWIVSPGGVSGSGKARSYPSRGLRITRYNLTGSHTFTGNIPYRTGGTITEYKIVLNPSGSAIPGRVSSGSWFFDGEKLYYRDVDFTGNATFSLRTGSGNIHIRNLKIYTMENGRRLYIYDGLGSDALDTGGWKMNSASGTRGLLKDAEESAPEIVYEKGEYVNYSIAYSDYEGDPSLSSYWIYSHTPYNDGLCTFNGVPLTSPVHRFYEDGRYELRHWQYDDTGSASFNRMSNVCTIVFYIKGSSGKAPWINYIETDPGTVKSGDDYDIKIGVGDYQGEVLCLEAELFIDGQSVQKFRKDGIKPDSGGSYPEIRFDPSKPARSGTYEIVAVVSNRFGTDVESCRFVVKVPPSLEGFVKHTLGWEENRREYNQRRFHASVAEKVEFAAYKKQASPRRRYINVFWPEERFMLEAVCGGSPVKVTAELSGWSGSPVQLSCSGASDSDGRWIYGAELWSSELAGFLRKNNPGEISFLFRAYYKDGVTLSQTVRVIIDYDIGYFRIHRKW